MWSTRAVYACGLRTISLHTSVHVSVDYAVCPAGISQPESYILFATNYAGSSDLSVVEVFGVALPG